MCKISAKNINFCGSESSSKFQSFKRIAWFIGNNKALSKFRYRIFYNLISVTKLLKKSIHKSQFTLTTWATLSLSIMGQFQNWSLDWFFSTYCSHLLFISYYLLIFCYCFLLAHWSIFSISRNKKSCPIIHAINNNGCGCKSYCQSLVIFKDNRKSIVSLFT